jgi:phospholipase D-like protein
MILKLGSLFFIVCLLFWLWAIFDSLTTDSSRVRNLPKFLWVVLILLFFEFGALAWVLLGRPRGGATTGRGPDRQLRNRFTGPPSAGRPVGPDDDPDFLRGI